MINIKEINKRVIIPTAVYYLLAILFSVMSIHKINTYPQTILYSYDHLICFGYQAGISTNIIIFIYKIYLSKYDHNESHIMMLKTDLTPPQDNCSICLDGFYDEESKQVSQEVIKTKCNHHFHRECLRQLLTKLTCPLCRNDMKVLHFS